MKLAALTLLTTCTLLLSQEAQAQNWWQKAKEALNSETASTVIQSLGGQNVDVGTLTNSEISAGLKEALRVGTEKVVGQLGAAGGFASDSNIHIPLPGALSQVNTALSAIGMGSLTSDLEARINSAAEAATPKAKALFVSAISQMTLTDAKSILTGSQDAATQYLKGAMGPQLNTEMQPIIADALKSAGAIQAYDSVMGKYDQMPFMPDVQANLNNYVAEQAIEGIFYYVAQEEAAIRANPAARTTDLLKSVFSSQ